MKQPSASVRRGDVVLVLFPNSDLNTATLSPALHAQRVDWTMREFDPASLLRHADSGCMDDRFVFIVGMSGLELLIGAIQAYVFALLTAIYINDAENLH